MAFLLPATTKAQQSIPANVAIGLVADQESFFLGENILLHYCITNTGRQPICVDVGGEQLTTGSRQGLTIPITGHV